MRSAPPPVIRGDRLNDYVRFSITHNPYINWWPMYLIASPINNQWISHQWGKPTESSDFGSEGHTAHSTLVCSGDFDCNTGMKGDTSYGRVRGYVTGLPPGRYKVTYYYYVHISSNHGSIGVSASLQDGNGRHIIPKGKDAKISSGPPEHKNVSRHGENMSVVVTVGKSGEALIMDYLPEAATPHDASPDTFAEAFAMFGITQVEKLLKSEGANEDDR